MSHEVEVPALLTPAEVAGLLRTSRKVVYEMIRLGRLPGVTRFGRKVLLRRDRVAQYILEREEPPATSLGSAP